MYVYAKTQARGRRVHGTNIYIHTHTYTCMHIVIAWTGLYGSHTSMCTCVHAYVNIYTRIHTNTYIYIHTYGHSLDGLGVTQVRLLLYMHM